jgi:hypothetical protein
MVKLLLIMITIIIASSCVQAVSPQIAGMEAGRSAGPLASAHDLESTLRG